MCWLPTAIKHEKKKKTSPWASHDRLSELVCNCENSRRNWTSRPNMMFILTVCAYVLLVTSTTVRGDYKKVGDTLNLTADITSFPDTIKGILWKRNTSKVAELDQDFSPTKVSYYGTFKGRTTLDIKTGYLEITGLQIEDKGVYSLELNSKPQGTKYNIIVIEEVPVPTIHGTCNTPKTSCNLTCDGDTTRAEPVTYSWRGGEKALDVTDKKLTITEPDPQIETYTCQMKNPVSQKDSAPHKNPFDPENNIGAIVGGIFGVLGVLGLGALAAWGFKHKSDRGNKETTDEGNRGREASAGEGLMSSGKGPE